MRLFEIVEAIAAHQLLLYHWTDDIALADIMHTNALLGRTPTWLGAEQLSGRADPNGRTSGVQMRQAGGRPVKGTSMTRNRWLRLEDTYLSGGSKLFRIGFNRRRLVADHRILPFRDWYLRSSSRIQSRTDKTQGGKKVYGDEAEEFVIGDIRPFWHYVDEIGIEVAALDDKHHASKARFLIRSYLGPTGYKTTGLPYMPNRSYIPADVRLVMVDRSAKRDTPVEKYFGVQRDASPFEDVPPYSMTPTRLATRGERSKSDFWWNRLKDRRSTEIGIRNTIDWGREARR